MKTYDILELQKMSKQQIESIAVEMGVPGSMVGQSKQTLIYAILDKQSEVNNGPSLNLQHN